jgi:hypothetical protein
MIAARLSCPQRLSSGELTFVARDIVPFGAKRFYIKSGSGPFTGSARAEPERLISSDFFVRPG